MVQSSLGRSAGSVAPTMSFRVADPEGPLPVVLKRHELADLRKLRVSEGMLTTLMSPGGDALTAVSMKSGSSASTAVVCTRARGRPVSLAGWVMEIHRPRRQGLQN